MYDEYGAPSETLVMDWNEHNDHADDTDPDADFDEITEDAAQRSLSAQHPGAISAPDAPPLLDRVRAAAEAQRRRIDRQHAEAEARRRAEDEARRAREIAETIAEAERAWGDLFRPDGDAPALAWRGYPSTRDQSGDWGPLAVAHLGKGVFVLYEPGHRARRLRTLAPCACAVSRYRTDTLPSAARLALVLDQILGQPPECAGTCCPEPF